MMPRVKQITPRKRAAVIALSKTGMKYADIAAQCGISKPGVGHIVKRFKDTGSGDIKQRSGRPKITSPGDDRLIRRYAQVNPFISSTEIKREMPCLRCHSRTICRRLSDTFGMKGRRAAKKPLLTKIQRQKRLNFCAKYKHWTAAMWRQVTFSDESTFEQFGSYRQWVRRPVGTRYEPRYTTATVKHPQKQMVWGCFSGAGRGSLYFINANETVNANRYIDILSSKLKTSMTIAGTTVFQQDSAPAHTAKTVQKWFKDNGVKVLDWPGNSPDLNPIENLWKILKRKLSQKAPQNMTDVRYWLTKIWCTDISLELCQSLVDSMPRRISDVIKNKGYSTKY
jgi:transposase